MIIQAKNPKGYENHSVFFHDAAGWLIYSESESAAAEDLTVLRLLSSYSWSSSSMSFFSAIIPANDS
jgi:hypothetical protein